MVVKTFYQVVELAFSWFLLNVFHVATSPSLKGSTSPKTSELPLPACAGAAPNKVVFAFFLLSACKNKCCHILCAFFERVVQIFQLLSNLSNVWSCVCVWLLTCVLWSWAQATPFAFSLSTLVTWNHGFVGRRRFCYFGFGGDNTARSSTTPSDF